MVLVVLRRGHIAAVLGLLAALAGAVWLWPGANVPAAGSLPVSRPVVILDAGHGGADGGAVSDSGVAESSLNLSITQKLAAVLEFFGQPTVLTRTGEKSLAEDEALTLRQQKVSDTQNRVSLVNGYPHGYLISIHQNCLPGHPTVRGAQVFYNGVSGGDRLAAHLQQALNEGINVSEKQTKRIDKSIYLMAHAVCPAALVECGFLSNPEETELLQEPSYQWRLAAAIAAGYMSFLQDEEGI